MQDDLNKMPKCLVLSGLWNIAVSFVGIISFFLANQNKVFFVLFIICSAICCFALFSSFIRGNLSPVFRSVVIFVVFWFLFGYVWWFNLLGAIIAENLFSTITAFFSVRKMFK